MITLRTGDDDVLEESAIRRIVRGDIAALPATTARPAAGPREETTDEGRGGLRGSAREVPRPAG